MTTNWRSLGVYSGIATDPQVDPVQIAADMKDGPFNALYIFLLDVWCSQGLMPWPLTDGKYDLRKQNQDYYDHLTAIIRECFTAGINIAICFFDIYQDPQWVKYGSKKSCAYHPFDGACNNFGKSLNSDQIYDSWAASHGQTIFGWISWKDDHGKLSDFAPVRPFGQPLITWMDRVMTICADALQEFPGRTILYKYANECSCSADGNGNFSHGGKSLGAGPEVQTFFKEKWSEHGLVSPQNPVRANGSLKPFLESYNWMVTGPGGKQDLGAAKKGFDSNIRILKTTLQEFHSIDDPPQQNNDVSGDDLTAAGIRPARSLRSRDGTSELLPQAATNAKTMYDSDDPFVDIKVIANKNWNYRNFQKNWNRFYPMMVAAVTGKTLS